MGFGTIDTFDSEGSAFRKTSKSSSRSRPAQPVPQAWGSRRSPPPGSSGHRPARASPGDDGGRNNAENPRSATSTASRCRRPQRGRLGDGVPPVPVLQRRDALPNDPRIGFPGAQFGPVLIFGRTHGLGGGGIRPRRPRQPGRRQHGRLQRPDPGRGESKHHHRLRRPGDRHPDLPAEVRPPHRPDPRGPPRSTSTPTSSTTRGAPRSGRRSSPGRSPWSARPSTTGRS